MILDEDDIVKDNTVAQAERIYESTKLTNKILEYSRYVYDRQKGVNLNCIICSSETAKMLKKFQTN